MDNNKQQTNTDQQYDPNAFQQVDDMNQPQPDVNQSQLDSASVPQSQNSQSSSDQDQGQQQFKPFAAFPANIKREYDQNIFKMVYDLVQSKYQPNSYIERMQNEGVQLEQQLIDNLRNAGPDISDDARDFEIARVYNKLEIEMFEMSTYQLSPDKQQELQRMTEEGQNAQGGNQQELIMKIREYMQSNVPNIQELVNQYMLGFRNQYLAGRY